MTDDTSADLVQTPIEETPGGAHKEKRASGGSWRWIALLLAVGGGYWGYRHCVLPPVPTPAAQNAHGGVDGGQGPLPVGVATIRRRDVNIVVTALGTVTPQATVSITSAVSGSLQKVAFREGQRVKKGDLLAQIDPRPYEALKAQYEGQLAHDRGLLEQARTDDERYRTLLQQNSIAKQTAEDQQYVVRQYEGTVRADLALVEAQALNIAYCRIESPIEGRVGLRLIDEGNYVQTGAASPIAVITQLRPISVVFGVTEDALVAISPKMRDGGRLAVDAYDRAAERRIASGFATVFDNRIDPTTGMVKLRAVFDNDDEALFPNQFVNVRLLVETVRDAVAVPTAAVQHGASGDYANVVSSDGVTGVRLLDLGHVDGDVVEVKSGLSVGEVVVVDGADRLHEGSRVRVVSGD